MRQPRQFRHPRCNDLVLLIFCLSCLLAFLSWPPLAALAADPVITRFESHAELTPGGVLTVTETITADMPGGGHGLFREIPYAVKLPTGQVVKEPPEVEEVTLDGQSLSATDTERLSGNVLRIYMRDPDTTLEKGSHTFTLTYSMPYMVGFFADYDELNWNVTGNLWRVPIEEASYTLVLPEGATVEKTVAWVGTPGSREEAVTISRDKDGADQDTVLFTSQRALQPGEGLTCAVSWNKGVVTPAEPPEAAASMAGVAELFALVLAGLVWAYFFVVWWKYGRDPAEGVQVPLFYAPVAPASFGLPENTPLSPAAVNYLMNAATLEPRGLSALLLSLVCRKASTISGDVASGFSIAASGTLNSPYPEEHAAHARLAAEGSMPLGKDGATAIADLMTEAKAALDKNCPHLWASNLHWTFLGLVLALAGIAGCVLMLFGLPTQWDPDTENAFGSFVMAVLALPFVLGIAVYLVRQKQRLLGVGIVLAGVGIGFLLWEDLAGELLLFGVSSLCVMGAVAALLAPCLFAGIMKAPSVEARKLMDGCEGLALYIRTAESDRFRQLNPPERTPELYSRLLPYAVALNLEKAWGENCAAALQQSQQSGSGYYDLERNLYSAAAAGVVSGTEQGMEAYAASQSSATDSDSDSGGSGSGGGGGGGGFC